MSAEVVLGLIPFAFGIGFIALALTIPNIDSPGVLWLLGTAFGGIGLSFMAAPLRYRRMLRDTLYAVTSRQAVIVNGVQWGGQSTVRSSGIQCESFDRDQARMYQVVGRRRDIVLGGKWGRVRRNHTYWINTGFLPADDPAAAEQAIRYFVATSDRGRVPA